MNKKGLSGSVLEVIIFLFVFVIVSFFAITVWTAFNDAVQDIDDDIIGVNVKEEVSSLGSILLFLDGTFLYVFLALWVGIIITSIRLPVENILFFLVYLIVLSAITIISVILRNAGTELLSQPVLHAAQDLYPLMTFFMVNFHFISFFIGLTSGIIFYSRLINNRQGGNTP